MRDWRSGRLFRNPAIPREASRRQNAVLRFPYGYIVLTALVLALAGCAPITPEADGQSLASAPLPPATGGAFVAPAEAPAACLAPDGEHRLWVDEVLGYCLIIPGDYAAHPLPQGTALVQGNVMNHVAPRVEVTVEDPAGRTLEASAESVAAEFGLPGTPPAPAPILVDAMAGVLLDNLPGQDLNRRVIVLANGRLYHLFFTPLGEEMDAFYPAVIGSIRFLDAAEGETNDGQAGPRLVYRSTQAAGSDGAACAGMDLATDGTATLLACDGTQVVQSLGDGHAAEWQAFQQRLGDFELAALNESLTVRGADGVTDPAWQRALLAWTSLVHAELSTGRTTAAGPTALSWFPGALPAAPERCTHVTVLTYGYAYADLVECPSGRMVERQGGWLTDAELAQFDGWLYGFAPFYRDDNYLDGRGVAQMDEEAGAVLEQWAADLHTRLAAQE